MLFLFVFEPWKIVRLNMSNDTDTFLYSDAHIKREEIRHVEMLYNNAHVLICCDGEEGASLFALQFSEKSTELIENN